MSKPAPAPAPDHAERIRALDPARSFIVQAPAGSGKTGLLTQRFLALLARVAEPESVVAITFTKKAAAEMRNRIVGAIEAAGGVPPEADYERRTWELARQALAQDQERGWRLVEAPSRLRIDTIDALCLSIARRMPVISELGGQPQVTEEARFLYDEAALATVRLVESEDEAAAAVRLLLHHLGNDVERLSGMFAQLLSRRDQWMRLIGSGAGIAHMRPRLEAWLGATYQDIEWNLLKALLSLLPHALHHLRRAFARHATIDFIEICLAARRALGPPEQPTDLALALGERIEHLLVDEVQDISRIHLDIISGLVAGWDHGNPAAPPRTLFLVGDPMQSIYRFREADVSIFQDLRRPGNPFGLEPVTLTANFRSQRGIVDWVNSTFSQLLGSTDDPESGIVAYAPAVHIKPESLQPAVQIHPFHYKHCQAAEAELVADLAAESLENGRTTAILVRARPALARIIPKLKSSGIPYSALDLDPLDTRPVVGDLTALTRALLHPADRVSWLAILRAPWCGLALADLHAAFSTGRYSSVPGLLSDPEALAARGLSDDARARLARVTPVLMRGLGRARRVPLRRLVEDAWLSLGGDACCSAAGLNDARMFFDLIDSLDEGGALPSFKTLDARLKELFALPDLAAGDRLQITTIHKAKGLEFDTVIIPGLGRSARRNEAKLLDWSASADRVLLAPVPSDWQRVSGLRKQVADVERERDYQELRRLLYVGATRARHRLHLLGHTFITKKNEWAKPPKGTLLEPLWDLVRSDFERIRNTPAPAASRQRAPRPISRVPAEWKPAVRVVVEPSPPDEPISYAWVGETLRHVGSLVHAWLHRLAAQGNLSPDSLPTLDTLRRALNHLGVPEADLDEAARRARASLTETLNDPRGLWILTRHADDHREYDLTSAASGALTRSIIDCTFIDGGTRWIIDYKTSFHAGGSLDDFLDNEQARYRRQLERYATLMATQGPEPIRLGLYFPLLQGWREWSFGGAASRAPAQLSLF
jgi:ATP-dependent exoDNAse (exonuclease V) beta subunit